MSERKPYIRIAREWARNPTQYLQENERRTWTEGRKFGSFGTVIAVHMGRYAFVSRDRFSMTTGRRLDAISTALREAGTPAIYTDALFWRGGGSPDTNEQKMLQAVYDEKRLQVEGLIQKFKRARNKDDRLCELKAHMASFAEIVDKMDPRPEIPVLPEEIEVLYSLYLLRRS
jgi:hypothetical protein